jgi:hypothetical protein
MLGYLEKRAIIGTKAHKTRGDPPIGEPSQTFMVFLKLRVIFIFVVLLIVAKVLAC